MAKKLSESSQREKQISVSAEHIFNRRLTKKEQQTLKRIADRQARGDDSGIDYSDIPPLTEEQLATARRPARKLIAARIDPDVFEWLQSFGPGYSNRINTILRAVMERSPDTR
jgi:uncharacterized protein (DUF4415 family)